MTTTKRVSRCRCHLKALFLCCCICVALCIVLQLGLIPSKFPAFLSPGPVYRPSPERSTFSFPRVNESYVLSIPQSRFGRLYSEKILRLKASDQNILKNAFQPLISEDERHVLLFLLQTLVRICEDHNITYMMFGGSLLGSYRHHGMIPWDEDIDIWVNGSQMGFLQTVLNRRTGRLFGVCMPETRPMKFYWKKSRKIPNTEFRWPYIDIFFWAESKTHLFKRPSKFRLVVKKADVFPLAKRPFHGALVSVPCNTKKILEQSFSPGVCNTHSWIHITDSAPKRHKTVPCNKLYGIYPFVTGRWKHNGSIVERVTQNGRTIETTAITATRCIG